MKTQEELLEEARAAIVERAEEQWARYAVLAEVEELVEAGKRKGCNGSGHSQDCPKGPHWRKENGVRKATNIQVPTNKNGREGEGQRKGNVQTKLPANAKGWQIKKVALKAITAALAGKGNQTFSVGNIQYTITQSQANHFKEHIGQKLTPEDVAKALVEGKFEQEEGREGRTAYLNGTKIVTFDNGKSIGIITVYHEDCDRVKRHPKKEQNDVDRYITKYPGRRRRKRK